MNQARLPAFVPAANTARPPRARALPWGPPALWLAGWLLLVLPAVLGRPLLAIDETRYATVAWEMWSRGEFLVPLLNGQPYSHKPPLLFWLIQLGWSAFGVDDVWPRLVPALFSLASVALTWRIGCLLWPARPGTGVLAGTVLLGTLLWGSYTPGLMFDIVLSFWVLLAALGVLRAAGGHRFSGWLTTAVGLGLGVLAKGPVALLHVLPLALLAPVWQPGLPRRRWYVGLAASVAGAALIALAWALPAALHGGAGYARAIFWSQSAERMTESFAHRAPPWWYLPLLPLLLFPWLCWPALWRGLARLRPRREPAIAALLCWLVPVFTIFCLISGKQAHYLLPLFPAAALLFARALESAGEASGAQQWPLALALATLAGAVLSLRFVTLPSHWAGVQTQAAAPLAGVLLLAAAVAVLLPARPLPAARRVPLLALVCVAAQAVLTLSVIDPLARCCYDPSPAARRIGELQAAGLAVAHIGPHHGRFHFAGRLREPIAELDPREALAWARRHPRGYIVDYYPGEAPAAPVAPEWSAPFRGRTLVLWPAAAWSEAPPGPNRTTTAE